MNGYFAEDSMARRVMRQRAVGLTWGQRSLAIGALHPRLYLGTAQHTAHRKSPYTRLSLTARLMESVFLGSTEEADRALAYARKRHDSVKGATTLDAGPAHPKGSPYSAYEPGLMWWTAAFALDSVEHMYDALVRRMSDAERAELFDGFVTWAELFGMPRSAAPASYAEFRATFDGWLASDEPHLVDEAFILGRHLAGTSGYNIPLRRVVSPNLAIIIQGSLPPMVRERYRIRWSAADEARWQALSRASRLAHSRVSPVAVTPVLRGRSAFFYKTVTRSEADLLRRGGVSMPGVSDVEPVYETSRTL